MILSEDCRKEYDENISRLAAEVVWNSGREPK